jgi:hypothetical protein
MNKNYSIWLFRFLHLLMIVGGLLLLSYGVSKPKHTKSINSPQLESTQPTEKYLQSKQVTGTKVVSGELVSLSQLPDGFIVEIELTSGRLWGKVGYQASVVFQDQRKHIRIELVPIHVPMFASVWKPQLGVLSVRDGVVTDVLLVIPTEYKGDEKGE